MNANTKPFTYEWAGRLTDALTRAAEEYLERPEIRAELDADPHAFFAGRGVNMPDSVELRVAANTPEVFHLVMPTNPNEVLADTQLTSVAGGSSQLHVASRGCNIGTILGSLGCTSTLRRG